MHLPEYKLIRTKRRTLSLSVSSDSTLTVRAPMRTPLSYIETLIREKYLWIENAITKARERPKVVRKELTGEEKKYYKQQALKILTERTGSLAAQYGFVYKSVKITSAKSRWGSCSAKGNINFTWRLIMAPLPMIDYVICHELAHLKHHNHSKNFWAEVDRMYPDYISAKKWFKQNQGTLIF